MATTPRRATSARRGKRQAPADSAKGERRTRHRVGDGTHASSSSGSVSGGDGRAKNSSTNYFARLSDVTEHHIISFLSYLPDRLRVECVCRRWRSISRERVPIYEMDFNSVVHRSIKKNHVQELFSRANGQLRRVVLSDTIVSDSAVECLNEQTELQVVRAHRLTRKHAYDLFRACTTLKVLEVLDCQSLSIQTWPKNGARLESASFNVCPVLQSSGISSLVRHSGSELKKLILKAAPSVDSSFFPVLAQRATELEELTLTYSTSIRFQDLRALLHGVWETLSRLDLSVCRGIHSFPDSNELPKLQVLILDKTLITDEGLESIARSAPNLEYLSLQNCRKMADQGIVALANGCSNLQLLDLKGTRVTDIGVQALEDQCSHLRLLRLDSCRNVSREKRHHYASQARELMQRSSLTEYEHILLDRKVMENVQSETESENDSDCSDLSE